MRGKKRTLDKKNDNLKLIKKVKKQKLQERGITLIALVVTVIILLILAGVTLNIALSDNGLFSKAKDAADRYKKAGIDEQIEMYKLEGKLEGKELKDVLIENNMIDEEKLNEKGITEVGGNEKNLAIKGEEGLIKISEEVANGNDYTGVTIFLLEDITLGEETTYKPIGDCSSKIENENDDGVIEKVFNGTFDGLNHEIKNLKIEEIEETNYCTGLFGYIGEKGTVENVIVSESSIKGNIETGAIAGRNRGTIRNCINNSEINGYQLTGGIAGRNCGIIENCSNKGDIKAEKYQVGGIAGNCDSGKEIIIQDCTNYGKIGKENPSSDNYAIGGIVGLLRGTVQKCKNYGEIIGWKSAGGIAGSTVEDINSKIIDCENNNTVSGSDSLIGGIVGYCNGCSIIRSFNVAGVYLTGENVNYEIGGIAGRFGSVNIDVEISCCYNTGKITLEGTETKGAQCAGIVGNCDLGSNTTVDCEIKSCYNKGEIEFFGNPDGTGIGGIVGYGNNMSVKKCYNTGNLICKNSDRKGRNNCERLWNV